MKDKPSILISNDDGITAPGIAALIEVASEFADVTVVAPDSPQSGMGHAITIGKPIRLRKQKLGNGLIGHACSGTPVDCVKIARGKLMDHVPDLLVSGINHGPNYSISVVYSGTMSAAMEGAIEGIPSIGFSLNDFAYDADFSGAQDVARIMIDRALNNPMPQGTLLNVNIPKLPFKEMKGIKVTRQAIGRWVEQFDERIDPHGQKYYWLTGDFVEDDNGTDHDTWALRNGYVSVCPVEFDLTAHQSIPYLNKWGLTLESSKAK